MSVTMEGDALRNLLRNAPRFAAIGRAEGLIVAKRAASAPLATITITFGDTACVRHNPSELAFCSLFGNVRA